MGDNVRILPPGAPVIEHRREDGEGRSHVAQDMGARRPEETPPSAPPVSRSASRNSIEAVRAARSARTMRAPTSIGPVPRHGPSEPVVARPSDARRSTSDRRDGHSVLVPPACNLHRGFQQPRVPRLSGRVGAAEERACLQVGSRGTAMEGSGCSSLIAWATLVTYTVIR